jgi:hypothetical protein
MRVPCVMTMDDDAWVPTAIARFQGETASPARRASDESLLELDQVTRRLRRALTPDE